MAVSIGSLQVEDPVWLAPMTGVSDLPFRRLVKRYGVGMVVSEMIASRAMLLENKNVLRMSSFDASEYPFSVQLAGCDPEVMAEAAKMNEDRGANLIDINFGCPVKKVVGGNAGSALMRDETLATAIMEAVVKAVNIPVTMKMRTGWDDKSRNAPALAKRAPDVGIQLLTAPPALMDQAQQVLEHYEDILSHYGRDNGVMIARKHLGWYSNGLFDSSSYRQRINTMHDPDRVKEEILAFYASVLDKPMEQTPTLSEGDEGYACAA